MRVLTVIGTRPEAVKMAPVIAALQRQPELDARVCVTGQHREMLEQVLRQFSIEPHFDLAVMRPGQTLHDVTRAVLGGMREVIAECRAECVLVHGDTTTAMASALAAFYSRVPVGHVEAGLRSSDLTQPWPEEFNRRSVDMVSTRLYAPTRAAEANLVREGRSRADIRVTGNTVIDALVQALDTIEVNRELAHAMVTQFGYLDASRRLLLVTGHRRENHDGGLENVCLALRDLVRQADVEVVYPVHPNPNVERTVRRVLGESRHVFLVPPLDYFPFVWLMRRSYLILTDSGGIQEEAPHLGKPVLVLRNVTERPEAVEAGTVRLVGTDRERIVQEAMHLLCDEGAYAEMAARRNPFGDGTAAIRIAADLAGHSAPVCASVM